MIKAPFKYLRIDYRCILLFIGAAYLFLFSEIFAQSPTKEVRAVWLTTVDNLDWPKESDIGNSDAQKRSLVTILDKLQSMNFNTIYFQVRPRGNAFYKSSYEPWAKELTGKFDCDPGWDPLKFITEEANKRGMEIHAWINVAKIWSGKSLPPKSIHDHILRKNSNWCKLYENEWWLDLGYPEARKYTLDIVEDILTNYHIDGLHFDYLRYPGKDFNDKKSFSIYGKNMNRDDWRRNNINSFLKDVKELVASKKPYVKVGVAPIGIYKNIPGVSGWSSYDNLFQDTKFWLDNDLVDYIAPQTYWDIKVSRGDPGFGYVIAEWNRLSNGKSIYPGIGLWKKSISDEIGKQIEICRTENMKGFSIYRFTNILSNKILQSYFPFPTLLPKSNKIKDEFNNDDIHLAISHSEDFSKLSWSTDKDNIKFFNIYAISSNDKKLIKIIGKEVNNFTFPKNDNKDPYAISYTTLYDNESPLYYVTKTILASEKTGQTKTSQIEFTGKNDLFNIYQLFKSNIYLTCYPNPFREYLLVGYELNQKLPVEVTISSISGKEILKLLKGVQNEGKYILKADGSDFEKGRYICTLRAGDTVIQKIIIKK